MASSQSQDSLQPSNVQLTAENLRIEISTHFQHLIQSLKHRESQLLAQLDEVIKSYEADYQKLQLKLEELTQLYKVNKKNFELSELHHLQGNILREIDRELESTSKQLDAVTTPEFLWNDDLNTQILSHGAIELKSKENSDFIRYEDKLSALVGVSKQGSGLNELNDPWGLDIDRNSGYIYISDQLNNRVQVYDSECRFKFTFSSAPIRQPMGITVHKGKVFVCEAKTGNILVFDLEGKLLNQFGKKPELNCANYGIVVHESTGDIYVCSFKNDLVRIYSEKMRAVRCIAGFQNPCYIQLTDRHIIVLDKGNPCLHWYSYDLKMETFS